MNVDCLKCYLDTLSGFLTPLIAISMGIIAYRQWRDSRYKIKIDLFDKRMKIYEIVKDQLLVVNRDNEPKINHNLMYSAISQSKFLFNDKVHNSINEIYSKILETTNISKQLKDLQDSQDRRNLLIDRNTELLKWLIERHNSFDDIFTEFMRLNKI
jgi:hypothetical protein